MIGGGDVAKYAVNLTSTFRDKTFDENGFSRQTKI